jgi:nucleotide-binding universal stress UspA family protein
MSAPVLVAMCPESSDRGPVDFAAAVSRFTGAPLVIVAVGPGAAEVDALSNSEFGGPAGDAHESVAAELRAAGVSVAVRAIEHDSPARGVAAVVGDVEPALIVAGSTRRGRLGRVLLGSTGERIVQGSPCPVAVVPHGYEQPATGLRTVGAAFTPSPEGREALRTGAQIARTAGAQLVAVMVLDPSHAGEQSPGLLAGAHHDRDASEGVAGRDRDAAEKALGQAITELAAGLSVEPDILFQDAADGLVAASGRLDLLVLGARAWGADGSVTLGGVAKKVTSQAACPVLVLPRGDARQIDALLSGAGATTAG